jgi:ribosome maturation factor RimP
LPSTYEQERKLEREVEDAIHDSLPDVDVLALELVAPARFCVYIDSPEGVDHALCQQVTRALDAYRRQYAIDVSSPGIERPLRKPAHFADVVGQTVKLRTDTAIAGSKRFRGRVLAAGDDVLSLGADGGEVSIPYGHIVRGNLIDEGSVT